MHQKSNLCSTFRITAAVAVASALIILQLGLWFSDVRCGAPFPRFPLGFVVGVAAVVLRIVVVVEAVGLRLLLEDHPRLYLLVQLKV